MSMQSSGVVPGELCYFARRSPLPFQAVVKVKSLRIFWSDAALVKAGDLMASIQRTLTSECGEIVADAHDWFVHVVEHESAPFSYLCSGEEYDQEWRVFVQIASFERLEPELRPAPDLPAVQMPIAEEIEGNDIFVETNLIQ
jgi:hypothetical protein